MANVAKIDFDCSKGLLENVGDSFDTSKLDYCFFPFTLLTVLTTVYCILIIVYLIPVNLLIIVHFFKSFDT